MTWIAADPAPALSVPLARLAASLGAAVHDLAAALAPAAAAVARPAAAARPVPARPPAGPGRPPATAAHVAAIVAAMRVRDPAVAVTGARRRPDGAFEVLAVRDGHRRRYDVSADLRTVTTRDQGPATAR